jgi:hypothetical protein
MLFNKIDQAEGEIAEGGRGSAVEEHRKIEAKAQRQRRRRWTGEAAVTTARVELGGAVMMRGGEAFAMAQGPLEHKTIGRTRGEGRRNSTVIARGSIGNEQPIKITSEEWTSTDLKVLVLTHHSDPRMGDSSYRLINIVRARNRTGPCSWCRPTTR